MKTNEKLITIAAIVVLFVAGISMGCIDKEVQLQINNTAFLNIAADALDDIGYQLEDIETAQDNGDFVMAKNKLATFDTTVKRYITEFEEMEVAENTLPCKKALIGVFEESQLLGDGFGVYLEDPTVYNYVRYTMQAVNVTAQLEIGEMFAENL